MEEVIAKAGGGASSIPTHPADTYAMKCIDLIDYGMVDMTWQGVTRQKHRVCLRFWGGESFTDSEGKDRPLWVDAYYTLSLHENSALRPFLEAWRGKTFTEEELAGFNVAKLVGAEAFLTVGHKDRDGRTYANILSISRLPKGADGPGELDGYVRVKDRPPRDEATGDVQAESYDDDLPF